MSVKRIAICDDDKDIADELAKMIKEHVKELGMEQEVEVATFYSAFALEDSMDSRQVYDIIFMDIVLQKENGIQFSAHILKKMQHVKIVFITGFLEYVEDIFNVEPFALMLKPLKKEKVCHIVEKALQRVQQEEEQYIRIKTKDGVFQLELSRLVYGQYDDKHITFTDADGNDYRMSMTMDMVEKLTYGKLVRCHKSYVINLKYVERIQDKKAHFTDGKIIPISRREYKQVYNMFMNRFSDYWDN